MEPGTSGLPLQITPHDSLRLGLPNLKEQFASVSHPVERIQDEAKAKASTSKLQMLKDVYGVGAAAKFQIETQILDKFQRLPGLPSSKLGLESLTGTLDDFGFEAYLGAPDEAEMLPPDMHSQMEQKLKMSTKPMARGMF